MFYEAVASDDTRSISMAVSKDGLKDWARLGRPILEAGQPGSWTLGASAAPLLSPWQVRSSSSKHVKMCR